MGNTKQKILDTSRKLFNDFGYSQVTIRMIASELDMSSGNLNYHFRKREDILEALYFEMVAVFDRRLQMVADQKISLQTMQSDIRSSMERMLNYCFFWSDLYFLLKSNKKIKAHFINVKADRIRGYTWVFDFLTQEKVLKNPSFPDEYLYLIDRMIDYSNTWLYASELYFRDKHAPKVIELASFHLMSMLYPYLTKLGKKDFGEIYPNFIS